MQVHFQILGYPRKYSRWTGPRKIIIIITITIMIESFRPSFQQTINTF